ncbi:LOW QUALITY PROTEIN: thermostable carboxypeptidase 1 [Halarchaeum acidiphilum MH1-52-1]|uniref:Metal-dependent carboxypeptidase n=1 Tax=Halarchaeum acidiphilum MH1-52-1 TaxID=1261545 RepID=U3A783_9EURY|nr:LOW QUALITY PROTEIN: thermostable carboxypeptidase 1 [Halarchaeum acidiphilum MH1-52-1]
MSNHREDAPEAYTALLDQYERVTALGGAQGVLSWDQQVMMPDGGNPARSKQLSVASGLSHDLLTDDVVGDALADLETADLTVEQDAVVREIERQYVRAERVPRDLVEEISQTSSEALQAWEEARETDDFETFAPYLDELVDLKREYAEHIDDERDPYAVLFEDYEPYLDLETAERVLDRLREELVPLIEAVEDSDATSPRPSRVTRSTRRRRRPPPATSSTPSASTGTAGLDTSTHPFTSGNQFDTRITTRFSEEEPLDSMMSTVHEFGHARYNLGLAREEYGTPLGEARDLTVHESQSRLWENHVGRSRAFWERFTPTLAEHFSSLDDATPRDLYEAANRVYPDNLIRVEADELTYHMHIVLRFEIERDLIAGDLDVSEVPAVWNEKMESYLGVRPESDARGVLQDIHWSHGNFGYFPTYSLGSVLAAQLYAHAESDIDDLDASIREGDFDPLGDWLAENVHRHGCRYTTPDLIEEATGEAFSADHFVDHVRAKFGELYDL